MSQKVSVDVANIVSDVTIFNGCRMKHSSDVATGILLFVSRCCDAFKYVFFILQKLIFYVATVCF